MRLLLVAAGAGVVAAVVLLWLAARDLAEPWRLVPVPTPNPEDFESIPVDPYLVRNVEPVPMDDWPDLAPYTATSSIGGM